MVEYKTVNMGYSVEVIIRLYPDDLKKYGKAIFVKAVNDFFKMGLKTYYLQGFNILYKNYDKEMWIYRWADDVGDRSLPIIFKRK